MITYDVRVCIGRDSSDKRIAVKCHDTGVNLMVFLEVCRPGKWVETMESYSIPDGSTLVIKIAKPDKTYCVSEGELVNGGAFFELPPQAFTVAGVATAEVSIFGADARRLTSATFLIEVPAECVCDCKEESGNYVDVMAEQIRAAIEAEISAKKSAETALDAAHRAEKAAEEAGGTGQGVAPELVASAVAEYMEKNPIQETDPSVPEWAKGKKKPEYTAEEVGALPVGTKIPAKTSDLTNDSGFITGYTETDPTVPAWAKASAKPTYSKSEVGLGNVENVKQYSANNPPPYPVSSVNGKTGAVSLSASDVGARPETWMPTAEDVGALPTGTKIPSKTSELTNDAGFMTGYTETDPTVPSWAKQANKPSYSKSEVGLGNVDNVKQYSGSNPPPYPVTSVNGKTGAVNLGADDVGARPSTWTPTYSDVGAEKSGTTASAVSTHNTKADAHNDIRLLITALTNRLDALANSDDETLDQMAEVVAYIKANRDLIEQITTGKVSYTDIVNNLTTNVTNKPLSAAQGVALKALIDAITVPTKLSQLTNDKGYITGYTETDPTVPAWAKAETKPTYTADEVGALSVGTKIPSKTSDLTNDSGFITGYAETDPTVPSWAKASTKPTYTKSEVGLGNVENVKQYSSNNPPPYPVTSVNGKTGAVSLSASDVGARPSDWTPTAANVGAVPTSRKINGKALSADITLSAADVGAVPTTSTITVTGVDADGVTHTWTMYGG